MNSMQMREIFLNFFEKNGHTIVASSSLLPAHDPTLLFANAGMNQFKDVFLGSEKRSYTRATSIQKCVRAGGKHNDLDNVGFTKRHLTFFEMMGNFSFGDYFKERAIRYAWDCLTKDFGFDVSKMYVTVYKDDEESLKIWRDQIGVAADRIYKMDEDNFWSMGDTGPCGPCTEIFVDRGPAYGDAKNPAEDATGERYMEVWNLVFMQYNRQENGDLKPLKQTGVDTGMGLERLAVVLEGKDSIFETSIFMPIIEKIEKLTGVKYSKQKGDMKAAFHVIADHIRSSSLLIADGCAPSNDGRGYVLRKIIRRAALFEQKLTDKHILVDLVDEVIKLLGPVYPELKEQKRAIKKVIQSESEKFSANLRSGKKMLEEYMAEHASAKVVDGKEAFVLYDTYGFPTELTVLIAQEHGFKVDLDGFEKHMEEQRKQSGKKVAKKEVELPQSITSEFTGYKDHSTKSSIIALIVEDQLVDSVKEGQACWVITQQTPFYVERGGQVSDEGFIALGDAKAPLLDLKRINEVITVKIKAPKAIKVGDKVTQEVNVARRLEIMKNHTATHLLQSALIELFGKQIKQSGSLVHPDYLRFDFTFPDNLTSEQIKAVEDRVNAEIMANTVVTTTETTYKKAIDKGVIAFFGDKYNPDSVRMVEVPGFSSELCGGTHVNRTGDIGCFKITEVTALSAGQRRLVAVTGPKAIEIFQRDFSIVKALSQGFKAKPHEVLASVERQKETIKSLQHEITSLHKQQIDTQLPQWLDEISEINGIPFLYLSLPNTPMDLLKEIAQRLSDKKPGFYFVVSSDDSASFYTQCSKECLSKIDFKAFSAWLKDTYKLRGGGKPGILQGGGPKLKESIEQSIKEWLTS